MAHLALYRKWRPLTFSDVVRQEHIVNTLKNSVRHNKVAHAYLFCGTRGTGKTTVAKILARAVNCLSPQDGDPCNRCNVCLGILNDTVHDIFEIDAASNTGVDNVREIKEDVTFLPSQAKYKVYIIDEVHMLSSSAFNALLKTLEEPPAHVIFILATTEPHKLPLTILSRCQRFDFKRIDLASTVSYLAKICNDTGIAAEDEALHLVARLGDGSMRDSITILERCFSASGQLTYEDVINATGLIQDTFLLDFTYALAANDSYALLKMIQSLFTAGKDFSLFLSELITHFRNLMICGMSQEPASLINLTKKKLDAVQAQANTLTPEYIFTMIRECSLLQQAMSRSTNPRILLETTVIKICNGWYSDQNDEILARISLLEKGAQAQPVSSGAMSSPALPLLETESTASNSIEESSEKKAAAVASSALDALLMEEPPTDFPPEGLSPPDFPVLENTVPPSSSKDSFSGKSPSPHSGTVSSAPFPEWDTVKEDLAGSGKKILQVVLSSTSAIYLDEKTIAIVFPTAKKYEKKFFDRSENVIFLHDALKRVCGKDFVCKFYLEEDLKTVLSKQQHSPEDLTDIMRLCNDHNIPLEVVEPLELDQKE